MFSIDFYLVINTVFGLEVTDTIVIAENPNEDGEWGGTGSLMKED